MGFELRWSWILLYNQAFSLSIEHVWIVSQVLKTTNLGGFVKWSLVIFFFSVEQAWFLEKWEFYSGSSKFQHLRVEIISQSRVISCNHACPVHQIHGSNLLSCYLTEYASTFLISLARWIKCLAVPCLRICYSNFCQSAPARLIHYIILIWDHNVRYLDRIEMSGLLETRC